MSKNTLQVYSNELQSYEGGKIITLGVFSSHWAACAAMIRVSQPSFMSLGGDKEEDLKVEAKIREMGY